MKSAICGFTFLAVLVSFLFPVQSKAQGNPGKLDYVLELVKYYYVDTVNEKKLSDEALKAMLKELDPHSVYIPVEDMRETNEPLVGKFEGVGIQFNILNDTIMVTQPIPGGPSEKLGIRAGDRIVKIEDSLVAGVKITNNDVLKKLRGPKGTKVKVGIFRRGNAELLDFVITRDQIPLYSVDATYMVTPHIGYIKISRFADSTVDEFKEALKKLKDQGLTSLILDLQGNPGGYLNRAVELADEFLGEGKKIVFTRGRTSVAEDYTAVAGGGWEKGKLAILIDQSSASASEIVSGAVQDWDRGLIVGRRSFGKGLVQKPFQLPDGSMIRLTIAHYYTPSGRCIQKPYVLGEEDEYESDIENRYKHGELFNVDSIHFLDSTHYFTKTANRVVHGGGGIMPDVFVPIDTNNIEHNVTELYLETTFNSFVYNYYIHNLPQLDQYRSAIDFAQRFPGINDIWNQLVNYAKKDTIYLRNIPERDQEAIKQRLKAYLARYKWRNEGFYEILNMDDTAIKKALEVLKD